MSPYVAYNNNALRFTDPNGLEGQDWIKKEGSNQWEWKDDVKTPATQ